MNTCNQCGQSEDEGCKCINGPQWDGDEAGSDSPDPFHRFENKINEVSRLVDELIQRLDQIKKDFQK